MKVTLVERREYAFPLPEGGVRRGYAYGAFTDDNKVLSFSSPKKYDTHMVTSFKPEFAVEIDIQARFWDNKVKYREVLTD